MPYLANGFEVEVITKCDDGYIVRYVYDDEDVVFHDNEVRLVDQVFDTPPTQRLDERVVKLQGAVQELEARKRELEADIRDIDTQQRDRATKFKRHKALQLLEDFIDGKITHYVERDEWSFVPRIVEFGKAISEYDDGSRPRKLKLLSLFGESKGDLEWRISQYSEGSGRSVYVVPVQSYDAALEACREIVREGLVKTAARPYKDLADAAIAYGVEIPAAYAQQLHEAQEKYAREAIEKLEGQLAEQRQILAKLTQP